MISIFSYKKFSHILAILFITTFLITSCATVVPGSESSPLVAPEYTLDAEEANQETQQLEREIDSPMVSQVPNADGSVSITPSIKPVVTTTVRPDLHATNPKDVKLASGMPQLVEFFAFW